MRAESRRRVVTLAKVGATLALLAVSLALVQVETLAERLRHADAAWLGAAALLLVAGGFAGAASWFGIARAGLQTLTYREAAACHWSGMFFNSFLPSNVGGDVVKGYLLASGRGHAGFVVVSLLADRALNLGMLVAIGVVALLLLKGRAAEAWAFAAATSLLLLAAPAFAAPLAARVAGRPATAGWRGKLLGLAGPVLSWASRPRLFYPTVLAAFFSQLFKTWNNAFVVLALGLKIPALCTWSVIPLFGVVSALPVTVDGLGLREMVAHGISGPLHADPSELVALSLGGYLMVVLVNMLGALPFLFARRRKG